MNNAYRTSEYASENQYTYPVRALKADALGYLAKYTVSDDLVKAIKQALYRRKYISGSAGELPAGTVIEHNIDLPSTLILDKEFKVLTLIGASKNISQVSDELYFSVHTINNYNLQIKEKMHLHTTADIIRYVTENSSSRP